MDLLSIVHTTTFVAPNVEKKYFNVSTKWDQSGDSSYFEQTHYHCVTSSSLVLLRLQFY